MSKNNTIEYTLINPTENYTILVLTDVPLDEYEKVAKELLKEEKKAEQVGFLKMNANEEVFLRMAGDEFCGNATMSAAVYYCMKNNIKKKVVAVNVYGINNLINVQVEMKDNDEWEGIVEMPKVKEIKDVTFEEGETLPVVFMDGIAHIIVTKGSDELDATYEKNIKLDVIKKRCEFLNVPALGVMLYEIDKSTLRPLVYVRQVNTLYWENSCASGTAALGYYLDSKSENPIKVSVTQACGKELEVYTTNEKKLYIKGIVKMEYCSNISL